MSKLIFLNLDSKANSKLSLKILTLFLKVLKNRHCELCLQNAIIHRIQIKQIPKWNLDSIHNLGGLRGSGRKLLDSTYDLGGVQVLGCKSKKTIIFYKNLYFIYLNCMRDLKCKVLDSNHYHFKCSKKSNLFYIKSNSATHNTYIDSSYNLGEMHRLWRKSVGLDSIYNYSEDNRLEHKSDNLESRLSDYRSVSNSHFIIVSLSNKMEQPTELDFKKSESSKYLESQKTENIVSKPYYKNLYCHYVASAKSCNDNNLDSNLDSKNIDCQKDCKEGFIAACNDKASNDKNLAYKTQRLLYAC